MERKESRNALELIKYGAIRLKGHFSVLFMGALAMVTPLVLVLLVPYLIAKFSDVTWIMSIGVVLFALMIGPLQMGYIKYFNETIDGKQPKLTRVYAEFKPSVFTLRTMYIASLLLVLYIVGGILWIIPACILVAFYSMTLFFLEKYKYPRLSGAMNDCAKQMIGNRLAMFSYKLVFYFVYLMILAIGVLCLMLIFLLAEDSLLVSYIVALCSTIVFIFMYTMVTVYYHSCNQIFFEDTLMHNERVKQGKLKTKTASVEKSANIVDATNKDNVEKTSESNKEVLAQSEPENKNNNTAEKPKNLATDTQSVEKLETKATEKKVNKTIEPKAKTNTKKSTTAKKTSTSKTKTNTKK